MTRFFAHMGLICLTASPVTAHGESGQRPRAAGEEEAFQPHWQPSFSAFGAVGGSAELTEGTSGYRSGLGGRLSLDYAWSESWVWANSLQGTGGILPAPTLSTATARTGVRYTPFEWLYAEANARIDVYPDVRPALEPVVGLRWAVAGVVVYGQVAAPYRFLDADDPLDIELQGGLSTMF